MEKILEELNNTAQYLQDYEKNSKWYRDYIDKICEDLKESTKIENHVS